MKSPLETKVIVIDDNPIDREICRRYLLEMTEDRYDCVEQGSISGALERVREFDPDCILLDYHLHDGNGLDFLKELETIGGPRRYPVVVLTATGSTSIAVEVVKTGAQDYLSKDSLNAELLHRTIQMAMYKAKIQRVIEEQRAEVGRLFHEARDANLRKDQFLATLSHELRTPLTPILTAVGQSDYSQYTREDFIETFSMIRRNIEFEARLIDDLLDLTRISSGKLEIQIRGADLHEIIRYAAAACESERAPKDIHLDWRLQEGKAGLSADPVRIQQVFWNLIKNAIKFTPASGTVTICSRQAGESWEVEISDTGIGLQPETEKKIFEAFEQGGEEVTRRFGGLGLGLAISKALVEAHHGRIEAANRIGWQGAVFTVSLPMRSDAIPSAETQPERTASDFDAEGKTLLLVEDHVDSGRYLKRLLAGAGYDVLLAESAMEALRLFRENKVDIVISDLGLPDRSGLELMREISAIRPVPAIALSGYGMEIDTERSLAAGFRIHLTKPIDFDQIALALRQLTESGAAEDK